VGKKGAGGRGQGAPKPLGLMNANVNVVGNAVKVVVVFLVLE